MDIIVCYKIVPDEQDIQINPDRTLSLERAALTIGQYDLNAVEAGVQLVEAVGGKVVSLTVGGEETENSKMKKSILSRGPQENYVIKSEKLAGADSYSTAFALAGAAKKIGFDLILCGEGSSDLYAQQTGIQLGEFLKVPVINGVCRITPREDKLLIERSLEEEIETIEVSLPAVLSVTADINITRVPSMKDILGAGKKPTTVYGEESDLCTDSVSERVSILAPEETERACRIIPDDSEENMEEFMKAVRASLG